MNENGDLVNAKEKLSFIINLGAGTEFAKNGTENMPF